ncbi:protein of unknown function [Streptococcus thermophilus]|uniref:Uncharacterized protein n=1 Tax=Streptococcus thermophilus TaxID=1308 RepID=A0A8D6U6E3_STRTR|nr:protein of unknown function [Streptococcus thermophilus]CAD0144261.1 protein of unknown function [Streptococcus thermophilus]CAD0151914.1 protein of unknown function [Streptococcus thermophilus]
MVQLPVSYDSLYLTYSEKGSTSFIFVESEDDKYRLEHDTPELGLELTNVERVSQQSCQRYPYSLFKRALSDFGQLLETRESQVVLLPTSPQKPDVRD